MPTEKELEAARQQVAAATAEPTDATREGAKTATLHAKQFVGIIKDEYHPDQDAVIQFTLGYFQTLKAEIDKGIMEL